MSLSDCKIIELPKIVDPRGNLSFIEGGKHVPFDLKRLFYLYDVPSGETRAGHALKECAQFVIATSGSFTVSLDDGKDKKSFLLNRASQGLYIPPLVWRDIDNFSTGSVCVVLASHYYDEADYYRSYENFIGAVNSVGSGAIK